MSTSGSGQGDVPAQEHSVLGRYASHDGGTQVDVVLLNFPLQVFVASRQRHDDLMREFALLAIRPPEEGAHPVPQRFLELIDVLGRRYAGAGDRSQRERDEAIERGELSIDLRYQVPSSIGSAVAALDSLMSEADAFCLSEELLTLASNETDRRFRSWSCQQFITQVAGAAPVPWDGPLSP